MCFLLRRGLAIWGHKEGEGNLIRLLHFYNDSPQLAKCLKNQISSTCHQVDETTAKKCVPVRNALGIVMEISRYSPK